jgi:hypothetical protein
MDFSGSGPGDDARIASRTRASRCPEERSIAGPDAEGRVQLVDGGIIRRLGAGDRQWLPVA